MNTSESINELAAALSKAQGTMKNASMSGSNFHLKSRYATLNDIIDTARKPLADNGLSYVQMPCNPPEVDVPFIGLTTRIMHLSGQWLETTLFFPVDGAANKAVSAVQSAGSILTYMRRYALAAALGIVADEDADGNAPPAPKPAVGLPTGKVGPDGLPIIRRDDSAAQPAPTVTHDTSRTYADGSPVDTRAVKTFDDYCAAHDGNAPDNVHNLRAWFKKSQNGNAAAVEQPALVQHDDPAPLFVDPA